MGQGLPGRVFPAITRDFCRKNLRFCTLRLENAAIFFLRHHAIFSGGARHASAGNHSGNSLVWSGNRKTQFSGTKFDKIPTSHQNSKVLFIPCIYFDKKEKASRRVSFGAGYPADVSWRTLRGKSFGQALEILEKKQAFRCGHR